VIANEPIHGATPALWVLVITSDPSVNRNLIRPSQRAAWSLS
jgi:hypothetical protein